jgi:hypothetical protein
MGRKRYTMRRCGDIGQRRGGAGRENEEDDASWPDVNLIGQKMKKINVIDSAATNKR